MDETAHNPRAETPGQGVTGAGPSQKKRRRFVILCAVLLMLAPLLAAGLPIELARWYQAAANEADLDGDYDAAVQHIGKALSWRPANPRLLVSRAILRLKTRDFTGSLADCDAALDGAQGGDYCWALEQRMLTYQRMGRHAEALNDADQMVDLVSKTPNRRLKLGDGRILTYSSALNNRAYGRALAKQDVDRGLEDINQALSLLKSKENSAFLDTRGYLHYLAGDVDAALGDMERAVLLEESDFRRYRGHRAKQLELGVDTRVLLRMTESLEQNLAIMYHHRGLVYQKLGREQEAERDLKRADKLGYDPENGVW